MKEKTKKQTNKKQTNANISRETDCFRTITTRINCDHQLFLFMTKELCFSGLVTPWVIRDFHCKLEDFNWHQQLLSVAVEW